VVNKRGKFGAKIYTDIMIFVLAYFILSHPVYDFLHIITKTKTRRYRPPRSPAQVTR